MKRTLVYGVFAVAVVTGGLYWRGAFNTATTSPDRASAASGAAGNRAAPGAPASVVVAKARQQDFIVKLQSIGWIEPIQSVAVKSRVQSQLLEQHFKPGQMVKKGDLLFTLDDRELQAQLGKDQAQLERDKAVQVRTANDLSRDQQLLARNAGTQQAVDQAVADSKSAVATVQVDQATLDADNLRLSYAKIYAPISGRIGIPSETPGNLVNASDSGGGLVTITQMAPVRASFALPERQLPQLQAALASGTAVDVHFKPAQTTLEPVTGKLDFIESTVDLTSGTVTAKATFANEDMKLWPGLYGDISVDVETHKNAVMAPTVAVQIGQKGNFVYVVKPDQTVEMRDVKIGGAQADQTEIVSGLKPDEQVVIDGQLRLANGSRVKTTDQPAKTAANTNSRQE